MTLTEAARIQRSTPMNATETKQPATRQWPVNRPRVHWDHRGHPCEYPWCYLKDKPKP